jgi:hypothetical protein
VRTLYRDALVSHRHICGSTASCIDLVSLEASAVNTTSIDDVSILFEDARDRNSSGPRIETSTRRCSTLAAAGRTTTATCAAAITYVRIAIRTAASWWCLNAAA